MYFEGTPAGASPFSSSSETMLMASFWR